MTTARTRGATAETSVFLVAAVAYGALGAAVSYIPPAGIDAAARAVVGQAPGLAWVLTESCLWPVLTAYGVAGIVVATLVPAWRARIVFSIVVTLVTWQTSNLLKDVFRRPRPDYWIVHHETTFAYSSGHAMFAVIVYWLWAYNIARSDLPRGPRVALAATLIAWGAGVIWSRLALGAHYPSDLLGGVLLAVAMLSLARAIARAVAPRALVL